jgi:hypothetical protein
MVDKRSGKGTLVSVDEKVSVIIGAGDGLDDIVDDSRSFE